MKWHLSTKLEGKTYYHDGNGGWVALFSLRHLFPSLDQARQTRNASIFNESIRIHGEQDASEEQQKD